MFVNTTRGASVNANSISDSNSSSVNNTNKGEDEHLMMFKEIKAEIAKLSTKYSTLETKLDEVITSQKFISDRYDEINAKVMAQDEVIKSQGTLIKSFINIVHNLEDSVRDLEQRSRFINVEVNGLPETQNENPMAAAVKVGEVLGVMENSFISVAHRVPSKRTPRPLILALASKGQRDVWLKAAKEKKKFLANEISTRFPKTDVFVNEHLTPHNKRLLMKTKSAAKENGYQYVWTVDGKILVRKEPKARVHRILNENDINELFPSHQPQN